MVVRLKAHRPAAITIRFPFEYPAPMRASLRLVCLLCALLGLAAMPAGASAKPRFSVRPKSLHLSLDLPASKGFAVSLHTDGHRQVSIEVEKDDFVAVYKTLGHVSRRGIRADLGRLGQISLRFRGRSGPKRVTGLPLPPPLRQSCRGRRPVRESGVFVGNLRFEGEHGYTRAAAHRLAGNVTRSYKQICKHSGGHRPLRAAASRRRNRGPEILLLSAAAEERGVSRLFTAATIEVAPAHGKEPAEGLSIDIAARSEKVEGVAVLKLILLFDETLTLTASPRRVKPVTAEATPPDPFAGTGTYLEEQGQPPSWSGTLGVHMPGNGLMPLAGPEFEAELCRVASERDLENCDEETLTRPLRRPLRATILSRAAAPTPSLWLRQGSPR